jgi:signal transduction histidine kinase
LAALGQMVAGVAHEINNPLAFVGNNLAVLQRDVGCLRDVLQLYQEGNPALVEHQPDLVERIRALADRIDLSYTLNNLEGLMARSRDGVKRIQHIVKDLRDFARLDESDLHEVDVNTGIESTLNIIRNRAKKQDIDLVVEAQPLPLLTCYPAKINQVVLNLVANAIDACAAGGRVTVRTAPTDRSVVLQVEDNGCGIEPAIRDKIFDPFFTTKPPGQGTGLGLSISYQIVQDHGGTIQVESTPGRGTCFTVRLPLAGPPLGTAALKGSGLAS